LNRPDDVDSATETATTEIRGI